MAAEKASSEKNSPADEQVSELDSADVVNPLYSLATAKSDQSSLVRQGTSAPVDQAGSESPRVQRSAMNPQPDDTSLDVQPSDVTKTGVSSSDVNKIGFSSNDSLTSMATLQISRPPQSSAVSEEQQTATVKVQPPPPAVPIRLVRAPSSVKPATNIPQVNCPEKIVSCLMLVVLNRQVLVTNFDSNFNA